MVQEILTYMIIGSAITIAVMKFFTRFWKTKRPKKEVKFNKEQFSLQHNCSDCSAECILREKVASPIISDKDLCKKNRCELN